IYFKSKCNAVKFLNLKCLIIAIFFIENTLQIQKRCPLKCTLKLKNSVLAYPLYRIFPNQSPFVWDALSRSEEHTSELQSRFDLVCRLLLAIKYLFYQYHAMYY